MNTTKPIDKDPETRTLSIMEAGSIMCDSKQVALISVNDYILFVRSGDYEILNHEDEGSAAYVVCTSIQGRGNDQTRYIYLAATDEVEISESGVVTADGLYDQILQLADSDPSHHMDILARTSGDQDVFRILLTSYFKEMKSLQFLAVSR
jgi:hypothetical protein